MDVTTFLQFFINGIVLGAIYVLLAIGLSIIFGMIGIVNLTHGILYMLGAYATVTLTPYIGFFPSLILSPLLVALFGMAVEAAFLRRIYKGDPALGLLFTFGLAMFLEQMVRCRLGHPGHSRSRFPTPCGGPSPSAPSSTRSTATSSGCASILVIAGLWFFLEKTRYGTIIRAGSRDPDMVRMLGISLKPVFTAVFGLGVALAAISGVLASPAGGRRAGDGDQHRHLRLRGRGHRRPGQLLGLGHRRPDGRRGGELLHLLLAPDGRRIEVRPHDRYPLAPAPRAARAAMGEIRMKRWLLFQSVTANLVLLGILLVLPYALENLKSTALMASQILIFAVVGLGFNILLGYTGLLSFGHGMFLGMGMYGTTLAQLHFFRGGFTIPILLGTLLAALTGVVVGFLVMRRRGVYFSLLTLAFTQLFFTICYRWTDVTGGENGLSGLKRPDDFFGLDLRSDYAFYYVCLVLLVAVRLADPPDPGCPLRPRAPGHSRQRGPGGQRRLQSPSLQARGGHHLGHVPGVRRRAVRLPQLLRLPRGVPLRLLGLHRGHDHRGRDAELLRSHRRRRRVRVLPGPPLLVHQALDDLTSA